VEQQHEQQACHLTTLSLLLPVHMEWSVEILLVLVLVVLCRVLVDQWGKADLWRLWHLWHRSLMNSKLHALLLCCCWWLQQVQLLKWIVGCLLQCL
jgi:type VI protein secretion system component VasK